MIETPKKIDDLIVPIYATYQTDEGVKVLKSMFDKSAIVILQFVYGKDRKTHSIFVCKPNKFVDETNFYDVESKSWKF